MITLSEIETIEAHAASLLEVAKKMRAKLTEKKKTRGLSESTKAMLDAQREKTLRRRIK